MRNIILLAHSGINLGSMDNPRRGFLFVNKWREQQGLTPLFKVEVAGLTKEIHLNNGVCTLHCDIEIKDLKKADLIIIPAIEGDIQKTLESDKELIPWLVSQYQKGSEIASLCVGAFMLASTGLLNGKTCSTHWRAANEFKNIFPKVNLSTEKIITDENGIYTSGGAFSAANLILYIIEKYAGREAAIQCSKMFQVDIDRQSQSPFIIFKGQKDHHDDCVKKAQEFIENNYREKITVTQLTKHLAISRRNLERRFKKATSNTLIEYLQRVKIEAAKRSFENSMKNINEVMYDVGYSDNKAFRNVFRKYTGLTPVDYRNKYNA